MAFIKQDMVPILKKYAGIGYPIYYLYQQNKICLDEVEPIFLKLNPDIAFLHLERLCHKIDPISLEEAYQFCSSNYTKEQCMNEYFNIDSDKIKIRNDVYETALNYTYTTMMLDALKKKNKEEKENRILDSYQILLNQLVEDTKQSVIKTVEPKVTSKAR